MKHNAVVVGLGRIGSLNDSNNLGSVRSHVGAILATDGLDLCAAVDPSLEARDTARRQWGWGDEELVFPTVSDLKNAKADVVTICSPTSVRLETSKAILSLKPKVVLLEKPLATNLVEAVKLLQMFSDSTIETRVVYHRRFDPGHIEFRKNLPAEVPRLVVMRYGRGLYNYGSHLLDMLLHWFGPIESVNSLGCKSSKPDPNLSFCCHLRAGFDAVLLGVDDTSYDQFDVELYYSDRVFELRNGGVEKLTASSRNGLYYPGYEHLAKPRDLMPKQIVTGFSALYENVEMFLRGHQSLLGCTLQEAFHIQDVLDVAIRSANAGGTEIAVPSRECFN